MPSKRAYRPNVPAKRPGGRPEVKPKYRVLVHKQFLKHWGELVGRVGLQQAQELWDHLAFAACEKPPKASTCFLRGKAGTPKGPGWSRTIHYELSSMARVDYQYNDGFCTKPGKDPHPVVAILTINYSSH
jgi:hypothetical protein